MRLALWKAELDVAKDSGGMHVTLYLLFEGTDKLPDLDAAVCDVFGNQYNIYHINKVKFVGQIPMAFDPESDQGKLIGQLRMVTDV